MTWTTRFKKATIVAGNSAGAFRKDSDALIVNIARQLLEAARCSGWSPGPAPGQLRSSAVDAELRARIVNYGGRYWVLVVRGEHVVFEPLAPLADGAPLLWDGGLSRRPRAIALSADGRLAAVQLGTKIQLGWVRRGIDGVEIGSRSTLELPSQLGSGLLAALRPVPHAVVLTVLSRGETFCVIVDARLGGVVDVELVLERPLSGAVHLPSGIVGLDAQGRCIRVTGGAAAPLRDLVDVQGIDAVDTRSGSTVVAWTRDEGWRADSVGNGWEERRLPLDDDDANASAAWSLTRPIGGGPAEALAVVGTQIHVGRL